MSAVEQEVLWALQWQLLLLLLQMVLLLRLLAWLSGHLRDGLARTTPERLGRRAVGDVEAGVGWAHHAATNARRASDERVAAQE